MRVKLELMFRGTKYSGWQVQKNSKSVQREILDAVEKMFCRPTAVSGCSRTDSGVHANHYVCHFDIDRDIKPDKIVLGLNYYLPRDIRATRAQFVSDEFHARYMCKGKEYKYLLWNGISFNPLFDDTSFHYPAVLDVKKLDDLAKGFCGKHDFRSFMSDGSDIVDTVREIYYFNVYERDGFINFDVCADGFLYNMVRILVGTLIEMSEGRKKAAADEIIKAEQRREAGFTAPAKGLYLNKVIY